MSAPALWLALGALRLAPTGLALGVASGAGAWVGAVWLLVLLPWLTPAAPVQAPWPALVVAELGMGTLLALALTVPLIAARHAGKLLELAWGGRFGASGALSQLYAFSALGLFASLGGLRLWTRTLLATTGSGLDVNASLLGVVGEAGAMVTQLLRLSVALAAPAWVAFVLLDLAAAIVARLSGAPGQAIVGLAMPLRMASVVVALPLCLDRVPEWLRLAADAALELVQRLTV